MPIVLGSRSPRRQELLSAFVPADDLLIRPPLQSEEQGFGGLHDSDRITQRLKSVVEVKRHDVQQQIATEFSEPDSVICVVADTIVVANDPAIGPTVLGQPDPKRWQQDVRSWMTLYSGTTHEVWTAYQVTCGAHMLGDIVRTTVHFCTLSSQLIESYIATDESLGKAGGYAIQGAASAFVTKVNGSLTNVIGLPVLEVRQAIALISGHAPDRG